MHSQGSGSHTLGGHAVGSIAHGDDVISNSSFVGPDGHIQCRLSCVLERDLLVRLSGKSLMYGAAARGSDAVQHRENAVQLGPSGRQLRKVCNCLQGTASSERSNGGAIELGMM